MVIRDFNELLLVSETDSIRGRSEMKIRGFREVVEHEFKRNIHREWLFHTMKWKGRFCFCVCQIRLEFGNPTFHQVQMGNTCINHSKGKGSVMESGVGHDSIRGQSETKMRGFREVIEYEFERNIHGEWLFHMVE